MLVGTISIEKSEHLSQLLRHGIPYQVLNAKHHEKERKSSLKPAKWLTSPSPPTWPVVHRHRAGEIDREQLPAHWQRAGSSCSNSGPEFDDKMIRHWATTFLEEDVPASRPGNRGQA